MKVAWGVILHYFAVDQDLNSSQPHGVIDQGRILLSGLIKFLVIIRKKLSQRQPLGG